MVRLLVTISELFIMDQNPQIIILADSSIPMKNGWPRPSKCLQHHQQRWCKFVALNILCFVVDLLFGPNFAYCSGEITYFNFSYLINCYYVALLYSLILKTVLLKYI